MASLNQSGESRPVENSLVLGDLAVPRHQTSQNPKHLKQNNRVIILQPLTSSSAKAKTLMAVELPGIVFAPRPAPDTLRPPVHEVGETVAGHADLKGADAEALLKESSPVVAIAYELARRGWLTIDHAHQIYLGLNFGKSVIGEELHRLIPETQATTSNERLSEQEARIIIEALLPEEVKTLWVEVFRDARPAKYTEDTGSYLCLRPKNAPLANQPISEFSLQVIELNGVEDLPVQGSKKVIVAKVGNEYHARIFDNSGQILFGKEQSLFIPDQVRGLDAMLAARLTDKPSGSRFPPSDAEILDGVAASIGLIPITFRDLFEAAEDEPDDAPLKRLCSAVSQVARFNARAQVPDDRFSEPDPAKELTEDQLATDTPFLGTHSGPILSMGSLRVALAALEDLASKVSCIKHLGDCALVWVSRSEGILTLDAWSDGEETQSFRASSTSHHVLNPKLAASRINPHTGVLQQVDCLFSVDGVESRSWNELISEGESFPCSMQESLQRTLIQVPLGRFGQELPILRDNVKVLIITPSSLSSEKEGALTGVANSLREGTGAHDVEFLTYEEALEHHLRVPSRENPAPENKVRGAGLVVLLDPSYGEAGDATRTQSERNLFLRLALSQQINSEPPTAYPFDALQETLIFGSRGQGTSGEPNTLATSVLWKILSSVFDEGMMKNPPTLKFSDEMRIHEDLEMTGNWGAASTDPYGLPSLSILAESVRKLINTTNARLQGGTGDYQFTACRIECASSSNESIPNSSSASQGSPPSTISVLRIAGFGSAREIVSDSELQRTKAYWRAVLAGMRGTKEYCCPLTRETFIEFFRRARFPITELEGVRFEPIRAGDGYRIAGRRFSEEDFINETNQFSGSTGHGSDELVRKLLENDEVALLEVGSHLCNIVVNSYPRGIPSPSDGAGAKPDGRFNENTMSCFGKRIVPFTSPSGTLCFLYPMGVTTGPLAVIEGIGRKQTGHRSLSISPGIDDRTEGILGSVSRGGAAVLVDVHEGGVGTAQEIFSTKSNILIFQGEKNSTLAKLFSEERTRQGLGTTLILADEPFEPHVATALNVATKGQFKAMKWEEFLRDFPVWDTEIRVEPRN